MNAYTKAHPGQVKYKKAFPFPEKDYMTAVMFSVAIFCGVNNILPQILGGKMAIIPRFNSQGSNAFAFHSSKTSTGEIFLAINAHQPLEGPTAFYEAHVHSDQGWNMLGGLLAGSCVILHGTNENLAQMTMFQNQQTKKMTPDKKEVLQKAEKIYNPWE